MDLHPSDWFEMEDNLDGTYSFSFTMSAGVTYGYNFNNRCSYQWL